MVKEKICHILNEMGFPVNPQTDDVNLFEYGFDSLTYITFVVEVENEFQIEISDDLLNVEQMSSLNGFISYIEQVTSDYQLSK